MFIQPGTLFRNGGTRPALDLRLAGASALDSRITFSRASTATYFDKNGLLQTASSGAARFTYDPATLTPLGLLIEESRTNLALQSNAFSTTWTLTGVGNVAVTAASGASPDGTNNAWKLSEATTTSSAHSALQAITKAASSLAYSFSIYAKAAERTRIVLQMDMGTSSNGAFVIFDLAGGQIGVAAATFGAGWTVGTPSIQSVGNGWYRCTLNATSDTNTTIRPRVDIDAGSGTGAQNNGYAGTVGSGVLIYGAQLEQAAFPTSYIPTTTASVTRAADVATMTLASIGIPANPAGLTIIGKARSGFPGATSEFIADVNDGTTNNKIDLVRASNRAITVGASAGGVSQLASTLATGFSDNTDFQIWTAFSAAGFAGQVVGQAEQTTGAIAMPNGLTSLNIGNRFGSSAFNSTIARLQIYNRRLPDAQAAAIASAM